MAKNVLEMAYVSWANVTVPKVFRVLSVRSVYVILSIATVTDGVSTVLASANHHGLATLVMKRNAHS